MTDKQKDVLNKYFTKSEYYQLPSTATKEMYITRVRKLANVLNKRAKTLTTAISKGRIDEDKTALFLYQKAVDYLNTIMGYNRNYLTTGQRQYERLSITKLRALEKKMMQYYNAETSTARGAIDVQNRAVNTFRENFGVDLSRMPKKERDLMFNIYAPLRDRLKELNLGSDQIMVLLLEARSDSSKMKMIFDEIDHLEDFDFVTRRNAKLMIMRQIQATTDKKFSVAEAMRYIHNTTKPTTEWVRL